jgi:hypothetical protein
MIHPSRWQAMNRASALLLGVLMLCLGSACTSPTDRAEFGEIRVRPDFEATSNPALIGVAIDSIRLVVHRNGEQLLDQKRRFTGGDGGYTWRVQMLSSSEEVQVTVELTGGGVRLYRGERVIRVRSSGAELTEVMMTYDGPELVRKVEISPDRLVFVRVGAGRQVTGNAFSANGDLLAPDRLVWSSTGDAIAAVTANGLVTSNGTGTARVIAAANGVADTLVVVVDTTVHRFSQISGAPQTLPADGASGAQITVTLRHQGGVPVGVSAGVVELTTTGGSLGPVTDHADGTYTATLTAGTAVGDVVVRGSVDGRPITDSAVIRHLPSHPDMSTTTISATPATIIANGTATSQISVQVRDADGNPFERSAGTLTLSATLGTLGAVVDHQDGRYSAVLTAATIAGESSISGKLPNGDLATMAIVKMLPGPADTATTTIKSDSAAINADGVSTTQITVELLDRYGNRVTSSGGVVVLSTTTGTLSAVTDHGNGTYTATLTAPLTPGATTIIGMLNGNRIISEAPVQFRDVGAT